MEKLAVAATSTTSNKPDVWNGRYDLYQERLQWFLDKRDALWQRVRIGGGGVYQWSISQQFLDLSMFGMYSFPRAPATVREAQLAYGSVLMTVNPRFTSEGTFLPPEGEEAEHNALV